MADCSFRLPSFRPPRTGLSTSSLRSFFSVFCKIFVPLCPSKSISKSRFALRRLVSFSLYSVLLILLFSFCIFLFFIPSSEPSVTVKDLSYSPSSTLKIVASSMDSCKEKTATLVEIFKSPYSIFGPSVYHMKTSLADQRLRKDDSSMLRLFASQIAKQCVEAYTSIPKVDFLSIEENVSSAVQIFNSIFPGPSALSLVDWSKVRSFSDQFWDDPEDPDDPPFELFCSVPFFGKVGIKFDSFELEDIGYYNPSYKSIEEILGDGKRPLSFRASNDRGENVEDFSLLDFGEPSNVRLDGFYANVLVYFSIESPVYVGRTCMRCSVRDASVYAHMRAFSAVNKGSDGSCRQHGHHHSTKPPSTAQQQCSFSVKLREFSAESHSGLAKLLVDKMLSYYRHDIKESVEDVLSRRINRYYRIFAKKAPRLIHGPTIVRKLVDATVYWPARTLLSIMTE